MVAFLIGLQGGFTKLMCYLCLWDSRNTAIHYEQRHWPLRRSYEVGSHNVKYLPLIQPGKSLMPPLHIKLGLIKLFVNRLDPTGEAFVFIQNLFPKLSVAKMKAGVFIGPQVRRLIDSETFPMKLTRIEKKVWTCFVAVVRGFLGNLKVDNYRELVENLVDSYHRMGCCMSLKLHVLHAHLDHFKSNMGDYSEEHGERFHQDIRSFEEHYKAQYNENMMGEPYIWNLLHHNNMTVFNRLSRRKISF